MLGGIGFTWEHDAHIYLRRAVTTRALLGGVGFVEGTGRDDRDGRSPPSAHRRPAARGRGASRGAAARSSRRSRRSTPKEQRVRIADAGYISPSWPKPWGREADAVEQLVIEEEFRRVKMIRPSITIGNWALPPLIVYGTEEQRQRWIPPTMRGDIEWCQLFSEPGAGSDLAGLSTKAEKVEGGWLVNGQKVWTSLAHRAQWGILLARTDPDAPEAQRASRSSCST